MDPTAALGRSETRTDPLDPWSAVAFRATLSLPHDALLAGDPLPPFWHWLYFREAADRADLGRDGHPALGGFLPEVPQPRRMWAGGRVSFDAPLLLGTPATRRSTIAGVAEKTGRFGAMTFVTVRHEIAQGGRACVIEEQDIVYRHDIAPEDRPPPEAAPTDETEARDWQCDETVLFRYSALTFNGHRIHYDLAYATDVEGYPGLVVHGPLLATLLLEHVASPRRFTFRARAPVFAGERFETCARADGARRHLWVRGGDGRLAMTAEAAS